jgi:hypothetical protein
MFVRAGDVAEEAGAAASAVAEQSAAVVAHVWVQAEVTAPQEVVDFMAADLEAA